jgi:hypothetical protein
MTEILPHVIDHAVARLGADAASTSFGLIAFVTLLLLLIERDAFGGRPSTGRASAAFGAAALPLAAAVFVMLVVRVIVLAG